MRHMDLRLIGFGLLVWVALAIHTNSDTGNCDPSADCPLVECAEYPDCGCTGESSESPGKDEDQRSGPVSATYFAPVGAGSDTPHRVVRLPLVRQFGTVAVEFLSTRRLGRNASGVRLDRVLALSRSVATTMEVVALPLQSHAPPSRA